MATDHLESDLERAKYLQNMLIGQATGGSADPQDFDELRKYFLYDPCTKSILPSFVRTNRDLPQFWQFIKSKFAHYAERREFIYSEFVPLLDFLERGKVLPNSNEITAVLSKFNSDGVSAVWKKALERAQTDSDGAVTAARSLLEAVCKHLLDELGVEYGKNPDITKLYSLVAENLKLSPDQHSEKIFKQILGGCSGVIGGLGLLRDKLGDAHGKGKFGVRPAPRHASLAVNLAGAMSMFLIETWDARKSEKNKNLAG